tara:strand:- start:538 stop:1011 length:474 start_codon:yes stop_codon:yes gene_type:complete
MKVLFYSKYCDFCNQILKKLEESKIKEEIKLVCIDENNSFTNIKIVPTIIDSDYKEILEGRKAFEYLKNKDFFDFPTNNVLTWKEKEVPNPKIEKDSLANDNNSDSFYNNIDSSDNSNENYSNENTVEEISMQVEEKNNFFKDVKLNKKSAILLRKR